MASLAYSALRLACLSYVMAAGFTFVAIAGAYWNVSWHDPWRTPRWTTYFILWWSFRDALRNVVLWLVLAGIPVACVSWRTGWSRAILVTFGLSLVALRWCLLD
jgi:hypothetical protein